MASNNLSMISRLKAESQKKPGAYTSNDYKGSIYGSSVYGSGQGYISNGKDGGRQPSYTFVKDGGTSALVPNAYANQLQSDLKNPLYIEQAKRLGIKNFNSANDVARVIDSLANPKPQAPAPKPQASKEPEPYQNEATTELQKIVEEQIKQNQQNQQLYEGMMNDLTARLEAAEQTKVDMDKTGGYIVTVGDPGATQPNTTAPVQTETTTPITKRKKPASSLTIESAPATGVSLTI